MKFKKGHRHSVENIEKRKKSKREVLSYEDMPLEEYKQQSVEISKTAVKRILIVVGILLVLGLVVFAIANRENLTPEKISNWFRYDVLGSHDTGYPVKVVGTTVNEGNFYGDNGVTYISDTAYESVSPTGNELCYTRHSFSKPMLNCDGDNVIVYNLGGNGYAIGTKKALNRFKTTKEENYIITADINSEGYYCVVTQADGYLSKLFVYNKDNEQVYAYSFAQYYINAVSLNNNGTGCVACGVSGDSGSLSGIAYILDFTREEPTATFSLDENFVYDVKYLSSSKACLVCSNSSFMLDIGGGSLNQVDYGNMELTAYDIDADTDTLTLSLSRSGDGRLCSIEYIDSSGKVINVNDTKHSIESISVYKNHIGILDSGECYIYDTDGKKLGKAEAGNGAVAIRLEDVDKAYVLGINDIKKITEFK
ncbi:MAG: hypothetical protein IJ725_00975 [Ruminococcus sp.]|nr:hypothetical protein [Ruminococcus sp.]